MLSPAIAVIFTVTPQKQIKAIRHPYPAIIRAMIKRCRYEVAPYTGCTTPTSQS